MTEFIKEDSPFCLTRAISKTMIGPCPRSAWFRARKQCLTPSLETQQQMDFHTSSQKGRYDAFSSHLAMVVFYNL